MGFVVTGLPEILIKHKGKQLDAATIIAIVEEASAVPDRRVPINTNAPQLMRGFAFAAERYEDCLDELKLLHVAHWRETEVHRHAIPLKPDYDSFVRSEIDGRLMFFSIRRDGELVGHTTMKLFNSTHTQTKVAEEDSLFLRADQRGNAFVVISFLNYVTRALADVGVAEIRCSTKLVNGADKLLMRCGFKPVAIQLVKILGEQYETNIAA